MEPLFPPYPQTVFRYRPNTPLSLKELQYGEVFFSAKDELNDPYDTKSPALFSNDLEVCERLVRHIIEPYVIGSELEYSLDVSLMVQILCRKSLLLDELIETFNSDEFRNATATSFLKAGLYVETSDVVKRFITETRRGGGICYIASFSKNNNNPVIWSHYANHHKGFCLCFSISSQVFKSDGLMKDGLNKNEQRFEEVIYKDRNVTTNGYYHFPKTVLGVGISEEERQGYWNFRKQSYLTKYLSWEYEQEVRLVYDDWFDSRSSSDFLKKPTSERIFYYDQTQLTGIILGSKMSEDYKREIKSVVRNFRARLLKSGVSYIPLFIFYQAKENSESFLMNIEAVEGLDAGNDFFQMNNLKIKQHKLNQLKEREERNKE